MILPVVAIPALNDQHGDHAEGAAARYQADTLRSRLAALSEIVLQGSGDESVAASADGYKSLLRECCCRVGPFDVLSGQADAMVIKLKQNKQWLTLYILSTFKPFPQHCLPAVVYALLEK